MSNRTISSIETSLESAAEILLRKGTMVDEATKKTLCAIPLLKTKAGPRDKDLWVTRLKEEYQALIKYVENNKVLLFISFLSGSEAETN